MLSDREAQLEHRLRGRALGLHVVVWSRIWAACVTCQPSKALYQGIIDYFEIFFKEPAMGMMKRVSLLGRSSQAPSEASKCLELGVMKPKPLGNLGVDILPLRLIERVLPVSLPQSCRRWKRV